MKYMSVITNFGCHYKCPYCIVKENNLHIPRTTLSGLDNLEEALKENNCDIVSISGGGDPLHEYEKHIDWYRKFFGIAHKRNVFFNGSMRPIPVEMHTSYMTDETAFPFYDCYRVVYHANSIDQLSHIRRTGNEIVRAVFVVTADYTIADIMDIALFVKNSTEIDELSFRQLVDDKYTEQHTTLRTIFAWVTRSCGGTSSKMTTTSTTQRMMLAVGTGILRRRCCNDFTGKIRAGTALEPIPS